MNQKPLFQRVTIIGLGLIGGSLGMALRGRKLAGEVYGIARRAATLRQARSLGAIDRGSTDLPEGVKDAQLVVIATPPETVVPVAKEILKHTRHRLLLTDVASTKAKIVRQLGGILPPRISYVGSHPMAGSEHSGIRYAKADLFEGACCILTPTPRTNRQALKKVSQLWNHLGGRVVPLCPARHDWLVAQISHVPHLAAVGLSLFPQRQALLLAAGGFADSTRVALSDPSLWREICFTNTPSITRALDRFLRQMEELRSALSRGESDRLLKILRAARRRRQMLSLSS